MSTRDGEQCGQSGAVVGDAGAVQAAIGRDVDLFVLAWREYRIEVRGEGDVGACPIFHRMCDDVAAAIDPRDAAQGSELRQHPFGAALLEESRGRDTAELQVLFVDPLLLPDEPLQRVMKRRGAGQIARHFGKRRIGGRATVLMEAAKCQFSVLGGRGLGLGIWD